MDVLMNYDWPGNVRELENVIEGATILAKNEFIEPVDIALPLASHSQKESGKNEHDIIGSTRTLKELEQLHTAEVLKSSNWNKNAAAKALGISLKTLYTKIAQYNLKPP